MYFSYTTLFKIETVSKIIVVVFNYLPSLLMTKLNIIFWKFYWVLTVPYTFFRRSGWIIKKLTDSFEFWRANKKKRLYYISAYDAVRFSEAADVFCLIEDWVAWCSHITFVMSVNCCHHIHHMNPYYTGRSYNNSELLCIMPSARPWKVWGWCWMCTLALIVDVPQNITDDKST